MLSVNNAAGKISDDRFRRMAQRYEDEQMEAQLKIKELRTALEKSGDHAMTTERVLSTVRWYTRVKKPTPPMLNELIEKIEVHQAQKADGAYAQRLTIHYNCVGVIEIPKALPLPVPDVTVNTRKGVLVSYAPL